MRTSTNPFGGIPTKRVQHTVQKSCVERWAVSRFWLFTPFPFFDTTCTLSSSLPRWTADACRQSKTSRLNKIPPFAVVTNHSVMIQNIESVLERGEKIELLVDKTDRLNQQAFKFEASSRNLRKAMYWKQMRCRIFLGVGVLILLYLFAASACGGVTFPRCRAS